MLCPRIEVWICAAIATGDLADGFAVSAAICTITFWNGSCIFDRR
jgi:hypothetical protein